jgi:transcriptional regulator with XRE-family HTH domain
MSELEKRALRTSPIHFAAAVRQARRRRAISRGQLALDCGLSRREIGEIEARRFQPTLALLTQLSIGLGTDLAPLIIQEEDLAEIGGPNNFLYYDELPPKPQLVRLHRLRRWARRHATAWRFVAKRVCAFTRARVPWRRTT